MIENTIDAVIVAGWRVLESGFSENSFQEWRRQAFDCVVALCGESHPYIEYFKSGVKKARTSSVLTGVGLLTAARIGECNRDQLKVGMISSSGGVPVAQISNDSDRGSSLREVVRS